MSKMLCMLLSSLLTVAIACKSQSNESSTKFDQGMADRLDKLDLPKPELEKICRTNPLFVFVGNHEATTGETTRKIRISDNKLEKTIEDSVKALERSLGNMPLECDLAMSHMTAKTISAMLLVIVDGPTSHDTKIFTTWYNFESKRKFNAAKGEKKYSSKWASAGRTYWKVTASGQLEKASVQDTYSEIHLPTQLETVVRQAIEFKPEGDSSFAFDQTIYMIKSHGGRFLATETTPTLPQYYDVVNGGSKKQTYNHAFLFDPHGLDIEKHTSEIYYPYIKTERACKDFDKLSSGAKPSKRICTACKPFLDSKSTGKLGKGCSETKELASNTDKKDTLSPDMNDTLSPDMNDTLSPDMNDTLSPDMNDTLSPDMNDTLSPDMNDTLSTGKSSLFGMKPADYSEWDEVDQMAAAVSYSGTASIKGLSKLKLPTAGSSTTPAMIVLDSCWGNADIASESFELLSQNKAAAIVLNPNPMGISSINYGALDYLQYLMVPYIQGKFHDKSFTTGNSSWVDSIISVKKNIDDYLKKHGLIGLSKTAGLNLSDSSKELEIYFIKDGKTQK